MNLNFINGYWSTYLLSFAIQVLPLFSFAQSKLPKAEVLVANDVKIIHVNQSSLRLENTQKEDCTPESFDRTKRWVASFYINPNGRIDSIYTYPTDSGYHKKEVFTYDALGHLVEAIVVSSDGKILQRNLVERTAQNQFYQRNWEHGEITREVWSRSDSITFKTIYHKQHKPVHIYFEHTYDIEKNIKKEAVYNGYRLTRMESKQWISENGVPKRFLYKTFEQEDKKDKPKTESHELIVDSTGAVVNKLQDVIFDPFRLDNYFKRYESYKGNAFPRESTFVEDHLVKEEEVSALWRFDGKFMVYLYEFEYE